MRKSFNPCFDQEGSVTVDDELTNKIKKRKRLTAIMRKDTLHENISPIAEENEEEDMIEDEDTQHFLTAGFGRGTGLEL